MNYEKWNVGKQFIASFMGLFDAEKYYTLRHQKTGSKILFAFLLAVFTCVVSFVIGGLRLSNSESLEEFVEMIPEFTYGDGRLIFQEKYATTADDMYFYVDTDCEAFCDKNRMVGPADGTDIGPEIQKMLSEGNLTQMVFVSQTNYINVKAFGNSYQAEDVNYSQVAQVLGIQYFSKGTIAYNYKGFIMKWAIIIALIMLPLRFGWIFLITLIWALIGLIVNAASRSNEDFSTVYWISFYMQTVFMVIRSLSKCIFNYGGTIMTIAFIVIFVIVLYRTLSEGDSVSGAPIAWGGGMQDMSSYGNVNNSFGVIEDDLDAFMKNGEANDNQNDLY